MSDHTLTNSACIAAMALGAKIVERHFTELKTRTDPDVICSMDENECKELITAAKDIPLMLGGEKKAAAKEQATIDFAFASVVTIRPVKRGDVFTKDNLWVKRPGTGGILFIGRTVPCAVETHLFGDGNSTQRFYEIINREEFWDTEIQKRFVDFRM